MQITVMVCEGGIVALNKKDYENFGSSSIYFASRDKKKVERMKGRVTVISTVCPDYPHDGEKYTFRGELGTGISLTAGSHLKLVPGLIAELCQQEREVVWKILVADLPELVEDQEEFYVSVAESKEEYVRRCEQSMLTITERLMEDDFSRFSIEVETFSDFYGKMEMPYLKIQKSVAKEIIKKVNEDKEFSVKFSYFMRERADLAMKFRGRRLNSDELTQAAAHGMSLYVTHGTLLRQVFCGQNLVVVNHATPNLQHFFLCELVPGYDILKDTAKFPLGIIDESWY